MGAVGATFGRNLKPDFKQSLSRSPIRSWSRARCSTARRSCRRARSICSPPPGSSSRSTTGSITRATKLGENDVQGPPARCPRQAGSTRSAARRSSEMRIAGNKSLDGADGCICSEMPRRIGGTDRKSTAPSDKVAASLRDGAKIRLDNGYPAGRYNRHGGHRLRRELLARLERPAHAVRPRAQSALRRVARPLSRSGATTGSTIRRG